MGTSKDVGGARSPQWSTLRRRATQFAIDGGGPQATGRLIEGFIAALGGAAAALAASPATIQTGQALTNFLGGVAERGATPTLDELGLGSLADRPRLEVLSGLADAFAGSGATLEEMAARKALVEVLDATLPEEGTLADLTMDAATVAEAMRLFLAYSIYFRLDMWIADRLAKRVDPAEAERLDQEIRGFIVTATRLELAGVDVLGVDWRSSEGKAELERILGQILSDLEANVP